jgi:tetratricopeptide (TPR) repeat protein
MMLRILIGLVVGLVALPAWAQTRDENVARCTAAADPATVDLKIGACTALLQSGQETAINIPIIYYDRGNGYRNKGLNDQAIADYTEAITLNPNYDNAYDNRGIVYRDKGLYDQAIADYMQAIALKPDKANAYYNRGGAYEEKGQRDQAIADYRMALKLAPNYQLPLDALKRLGVTP